MLFFGMTTVLIQLKFKRDLGATSVDSEYLLTQVVTRECLFFDTFWYSSALEFDWSLINETRASQVLNS